MNGPLNQTWRRRLATAGELRFRRFVSQSGWPIQLIAGGILLAVIIVAIYDLYGAFHFSETDIKFDRIVPDPEFEAKIRLPNLNFDGRTNSFNGQVTIDVDSRRQHVGVDDLAFSFQENTDQSRGYVMSWEQFETGEYTPAWKGPPHDSAWAITQLSLPAYIVRPAVMYPFDNYLLIMNLVGCANNAGAACSETQNYNVGINNVLLTSISSDLVITNVTQTKPYIFSVSFKRSPFVRIAAIAFAPFAIYFLFYLRRLQDNKTVLTEALGFLAALWGLRSLFVPASVAIFPTVIDYFILILLTFLFYAIVWKTTSTS